ncbi:hypothetical protein DTO063F5_4405 [Paecilomyces variotii]|nr:hypothetical protein DTO063F5_4405 [Paecilomyces variotii]
MSDENNYKLGRLAVDLLVSSYTVPSLQGAHNQCVCFSELTNRSLLNSNAFLETEILNMALSGIGVAGIFPTALSLNGEYAVRLVGRELVIHAASGVSGTPILGIIKLKEHIASQLKLFRFFNVSNVTHETDDEVDTMPYQRLLCATDTHISVWQLHPLEWLADIDNVEPALTYADFGGDMDEVVVGHSWNTKITIFNLRVGRSQIIKSSKLSNTNGYGYRPRTNQLAILLKPEVNDLLTIHEPRTYELITRVTLPTTDAQGLKWSPDGRWIAVWEAASAGTKVLIYTPEGQLFRTYCGPPGYDSTYDLGVRTIEWSSARHPMPVSDYLAVGKFDGSVDILNSKTFSCSVSLSHNSPIDDSSPNVWRETYTNSGELEYVDGSDSAAFSVATDSSGHPRGISMLSFSTDGDLLATVDQSRPSVVWIWSLGKAASLKCVLVHEDPVRQLSWHPTEAELTIISSNSTIPAVHLWTVGSDPVIVRVPVAQNESGKYEVTRVHSSAGEGSKLWFTTPDDCVLGSVTRENGQAQFNVLHSVKEATSTAYVDVQTVSH